MAKSAFGANAKTKTKTPRSEMDRSGEFFLADG
jgi:hypothetical protein